MLARAARTIARFLAKSQPPFVGVADGSRVIALPHRDTPISCRRVAFSTMAGNNPLGRQRCPAIRARGRIMAGSDVSRRTLIAVSESSPAAPRIFAASQPVPLPRAGRLLVELLDRFL